MCRAILSGRLFSDSMDVVADLLRPLLRYETSSHCKNSNLISFRVVRAVLCVAFTCMLACVGLFHSMPLYSNAIRLGFVEQLVHQCA